MFRTASNTFCNDSGWKAGGSAPLGDVSKTQSALVYRDSDGSSSADLRSCSDQEVESSKDKRSPGIERFGSLCRYRSGFLLGRFLDGIREGEATPATTLSGAVGDRNEAGRRQQVFSWPGERSYRLVVDSSRISVHAQTVRKTACCFRCRAWSCGESISGSPGDGQTSHRTAPFASDRLHNYGV